MRDEMPSVEGSRPAHNRRSDPPLLPGIIYCNGGLAAAESVADFAVAMVISTFRQLPWATSAALIPSITASPSAAEAAFRFSHLQMTAHSRNPRGHTLGVIGFGKIGQLIAQKLGHDQSFGMRVHYHDIVRQPPAREAELYGATYHDTLRALMGVSDVVVLATPAIPGGGPLITRETIGWIKPGGRFINIARGSLVDEDALAEALESGRLSAAGLDVHSDEPRVSPKLLKFAGADLATAGEEGGKMREDGTGLAVNPGRVMLTCHNAGGTVETHIGFEELAMRNILAVLGGKNAITPVNLRFLPKRESRL